MALLLVTILMTLGSVFSWSVQIPHPDESFGQHLFLAQEETDDSLDDGIEYLDNPYRDSWRRQWLDSIKAEHDLLLVPSLRISPYSDAVYYGHAPHAFSPTDSTPPARQYSDDSFRGELFRHQVSEVGRQTEVGVEESLEEYRDIIDSPEIDTTNDWTPFYS